MLYYITAFHEYIAGKRILRSSASLAKVCAMCELLNEMEQALIYIFPLYTVVIPHRRIIFIMYPDHQRSIFMKAICIPEALHTSLFCHLVSAAGIILKKTWHYFPPPVSFLFPREVMLA